MPLFITVGDDALIVPVYLHFDIGRMWASAPTVWFVFRERNALPYKLFLYYTTQDMISDMMFWKKFEKILNFFSFQFSVYSFQLGNTVNLRNLSTKDFPCGNCHCEGVCDRGSLKKLYARTMWIATPILIGSQ